jgi:hypothetical protein
MKAYETFFAVAEDQIASLADDRFQISLEYGSIQDVEEDVDAKEEQLIKEFLQALSPDSAPSPEESSPLTAISAQAIVEPPNDVRGVDSIFDIDSLLAAQSAAEAISICLPSPNDGWWNDIFGQDPGFETFAN